MQPASLLPPDRPAQFFDPHGATTGRLEVGEPCLIGTTTERAALFAAPCLLRRNRSGRTGCPLMVKSVAAQFTQPAHAGPRCDSSRTMRPECGRPSFETRLRRSSG